MAVDLLRNLTHPDVYNVWAEAVNSEVKQCEDFIPPSVRIYTPKKVFDAVPKSILEETKVACENSSRQETAGLETSESSMCRRSAVSRLFPTLADDHLTLVVITSPPSFIKVCFDSGAASQIRFEGATISKTDAFPFPCQHETNQGVVKERMAVPDPRGLSACLAQEELMDCDQTLHYGAEKDEFGPGEYAGASLPSAIKLLRSCLKPAQVFSDEHISCISVSLHSNGKVFSFRKLAPLLRKAMIRTDFDSDLQMANKSLSASGTVVIFTHSSGQK
ncbi:hypothetical protein Baya_7135 [Bagarius yarrelli]|uniref:Uncharacterized protein n=1 Tax=Bagarius yarrelli TaxID=175774 RepID=A0A556TZD8_BAGYA|nr:hypothetical protein Baya_7135 [Bagarius yarrelli]